MTVSHITIQQMAQVTCCFILITMRQTATKKDNHMHTIIRRNRFLHPEHDGLVLGVVIGRRTDDRNVTGWGGRRYPKCDTITIG